MKHAEARPYADPEAAARSSSSSPRAFQRSRRPHPHREDQRALSCSTRFKAERPEFGAGISYAIEHGWLELHESGTYVRLLTPGKYLLS